LYRKKKTIKFFSGDFFKLFSRECFFLANSISHGTHPVNGENDDDNNNNNNRWFEAEVPNCRTAKDYRLRQGVKRNYVRGLAQMFNATADNAGCRYPRSDTNLPYPIDPVLRSTLVLCYYYYDAYPESASRSQRKSTPISWRFSMKYKLDICFCPQIRISFWFGRERSRGRRNITNITLSVHILMTSSLSYLRRFIFYLRRHWYFQQ